MFMIRYSTDARVWWGTKRYDTREEAEQQARKATTRAASKYDPEGVPTQRAEVMQLVPVAEFRR